MSYVFDDDLDPTIRASVWRPEEGCDDPDASFTADVTSGEVPLSVQFAATTPIFGREEYTYAWDFGDGDISTEQNPLHVFTEPGIYTVSLTITNPCADTDTVEITVVAQVEDELLLDHELLTGLWHIAYGVTRLTATYTGPLLRVRNSTTGVETDIPYDVNNRLDQTAMLAALGANSGTVAAWYDQSGSGYHVYNADVAEQPLIWITGTYLDCVKSDGVDDWLVSTLDVPTEKLGPRISVITEGIEYTAHNASSSCWNVGVPKYHSIADAFFPRTAYGTDNDAFISIDSLNDTPAVTISMLDTTQSNADTENTIYRDGSEPLTLYSQSNTHPAGLSAGKVRFFVFLIGVTNHAASELRHWIMLNSLLSDSQRAVFDAWDYS